MIKKLDKKLYETYIVIDGNLEDPNIEEVINKYLGFFRKNNVEVKNIERMGRRRLAYPIRRKLNGYYVCFLVEAAPAFIKKLERSYRIDESVLRYLTIYMSKRTLEEKELYLKKKAETNQQEETSAPEGGESVSTDSTIAEESGDIKEEMQEV
ncbi:MAG: 30S ribosomal protein S6 [Ignavibacteria bacterium]